MKNKNIQSWGLIALVITALVGGYFLFAKADTYQGVYYPDGCLVCKDNYIFSPIFNDGLSCINWGQGKALERRNAGLNVEADLAECGKNCKWDGGFMVCKETFDIEL